MIEAADAKDREKTPDAIHPPPAPVYVRVFRGDISRLFDTPLEMGDHQTIVDGQEIIVLVSGHPNSERPDCRRAFVTFSHGRSDGYLDHFYGIRTE